MLPGTGSPLSCEQTSTIPSIIEASINVSLLIRVTLQKLHDFNLGVTVVYLTAQANLPTINTTYRWRLYLVSQLLFVVCSSYGNVAVNSSSKRMTDTLKAGSCYGQKKLIYL